ncbi:MAG: alpha/beta hydrolase [Elusimicrobia bacterium]|nr:alpha/beta hydrolase [Elusimicrobiota bacterium]
MTSALLLAAALGALAAPAPAGPRPFPGEPVLLKTADGWTLHAAWLRAKPGRPTLVLLHGTGQRREDWRSFAAAAARRGFGVLGVDLRGHGESRVTPAGETIVWRKLSQAKGANDYEDMTRDVEAAAAFLAAQGLPEDEIGLIGAEVGSSVAVKYAAVHSGVPFLVMLSPGLAWREVPIVNALRAFRGRSAPILMVHAEKDKLAAKEVPLLHAFAVNSVGARRASLLVVAEERGTRMLARNKGLTARVLDWIDDPVPPEAPAASTAPAAGAPAADLGGAADEGAL